MNDYIPSGLGWPRRESAAMLVKGYAAGRATRVSSVDAGCSLVTYTQPWNWLQGEPFVFWLKCYLNHYKQIYTKFILHHGTWHELAEERLEDITLKYQITDQDSPWTNTDSEREIMSPPSAKDIRIETLEGLHQSSLNAGLFNAVSPTTFMFW